MAEKKRKHKHEPVFNEKWPASKCIKYLEDAGLTWTDHDDLAEQICMSVTRVSNVLLGGGTRFVLDKWILRARHNSGEFATDGSVRVSARILDAQRKMDIADRLYQEAEAILTSLSKKEKQSLTTWMEKVTAAIADK